METIKVSLFIQISRSLCTHLEKLGSHLGQKHKSLVNFLAFTLENSLKPFKFIFSKAILYLFVVYSEKLSLHSICVKGTYFNFRPSSRAKMVSHL